MEKPMTTLDTRLYRANLSTIPQEKRGELRHKLVPWIYTNDRGFKDALPVIDQMMREQKRNGKPHTAVLSGVGSLLNIAPFVDVDFFVSVDRNSFVLDQVMEMVHMVKEADTPERCLQSSFLTQFFEEMTQRGVETGEYFDIERH